MKKGVHGSFTQWLLLRRSMLTRLARFAGTRTFPHRRIVPHHHLHLLGLRSLPTFRPKIGMMLPPLSHPYPRYSADFGYFVGYKVILLCYFESDHSQHQPLLCPTNPLCTKILWNARPLLLEELTTHPTIKARFPNHSPLLRTLTPSTSMPQHSNTHSLYSTDVKLLVL